MIAHCDILRRWIKFDHNFISEKKHCKKNKLKMRNTKLMCHGLQFIMFRFRQKNICGRDGWCFRLSYLFHWLVGNLFVYECPSPKVASLFHILKWLWCKFFGIITNYIFFTTLCHWSKREKYWFGAEEGVLYGN